MLKITNAKTTLDTEIKATLLGTVNYSISVIEAGSIVQVVHTISSEVTSKVIQWVTSELDLSDYENKVKSKIEEQYPKSEEPQPDYSPIDIEKIAW